MREAVGHPILLLEKRLSRAATTAKQSTPGQDFQKHRAMAWPELCAGTCQLVVHRAMSRRNLDIDDELDNEVSDAAGHAVRNLHAFLPWMLSVQPPAPVHALLIDFVSILHSCTLS